MSNPLVRRGLEQGIQAGRSQTPAPSAEQLDQMYRMPSAERPTAPAERPMTYDDVLMKTAFCFAVLLAGAVAVLVRRGGAPPRSHPTPYRAVGRRPPGTGRSCTPASSASGPATGRSCTT